ncbi:winged helix DNA-binding domain-containing protein [Solitalea canadensis]|uniref:Winged helix DNA-binding domain-containing protein n=1 Tax=Solitalea canadensis (strain ATCC 29591 / DSM 3403 / JCM 21819 / LMG 8368 / NBRC 15130 / NCIMB 12057 / USAM 9D) TaxID=929556 RepID=H8KLT8_SOLCM|nr:winged helix DNA-binding domain-containing protein [Solitalea canadensis]AFD08666.1 hypothetical protein Solca_3662 [Solitalea canadensis DSM 3403]
MVKWFGGIQAQDYPAAKWALGLRLKNITQTQIESEIAAKKFVRTWMFRGTLHFIAADDVNWMLDLVAPGIISKFKSRHRELGLTPDVLAKAEKVIVTMLSGDKVISRKNLFEELELNGVATKDQKGIHLMLWASYNKLICHGPTEGKQFTYTLYDDWIAKNGTIPREEALAKLALRYFTGHGPATLQDFMWWSGLGVNDTKKGLEAVRSQLLIETVEGQEYFMQPELPELKKTSVKAFLLPAFDEFYLAYKNRNISLESHHHSTVASVNGIFFPTIVVGNRIVGLWKKEIKKNSVLIDLKAFIELKNSQKDLIAKAAKDYGRFLGMKTEVIE